MKAMLNAVKRHNENNKEKIKSVACTGLGTFYGKMDLEEASRQMKVAYSCFMNPPKKITW
jgi:O-acetyl-ADP-ribose deacetylase (regulator of RNase III)